MKGTELLEFKLKELAKEIESKFYVESEVDTYGYFIDQAFDLIEYTDFENVEVSYQKYNAFMLEIKIELYDKDEELLQNIRFVFDFPQKLEI